MLRTMSDSFAATELELQSVFSSDVQERIGDALDARERTLGSESAISRVRRAAQGPGSSRVLIGYTAALTAYAWIRHQHRSA